VRHTTLLVTTSWLLTTVLGVTAYAQDIVLTPSELNAHADRYDGKTVRVRGWLSLYFEDYGLWDSKKAHDTERTSAPPWPPSCVSVDSYVAGKVKKPASQSALVDGIFRKQFLPPNTISNGVCNNTGLQVTRVRKPNA